MGRLPHPREVKLLEATVGPGRYRVLTRRPLTIAFGPKAYAPALMSAVFAFVFEVRVGPGAAVVSAAIAGVALAFGLAVHEAGHLLFGRRVRGVIPRILLLRSSGGASIVEGRFQDARGAAVYAAGGPAATVTLTLVYLDIATIVPWQPVTIGFLLPAVLSTLMLVINLIPVAPTDGYALLRSALWAETGSRAEAERRAIAWSRAVLAVGLVVALLLVAHHQLAALTVFFALATLTVQHHAVARRLARDSSQG
jgi:Zn-dependent protease